MKKKYTKPHTELEPFAELDILTASGTTDDRDPADNDIEWGS